MEKPKILEVKRKRIKKRKGNKNLLKKCLGLDQTPRKFKTKGGKKKNLSSSQSSENAEKPDMDPSPPRPFENVKKENLVLSPIPLCANVKKEDLVSSQESRDKMENLSDNHAVELSLPAKPYHSGEKASNGTLLETHLDNQDGGRVSENEAPVIEKSYVKNFTQLDLAETLVNGIDSSSTATSIAIPDPARLWPTVNAGSGDEMAVTSTVNDCNHAQSEESFDAREMDTSVSNYTNDLCMNHISTDLESSPILHGLGMLLESL